VGALASREETLDRVRARREPWDLAIIGGGATGAGIALDAVSRGYEVLLVERGDFGCGTSSRSTKLIHGGVRYLEQGNVSLVMEALKERGLLRRNAPAFVSELAFVVPHYDWWEAPFYGLGLKLYDLLAGRYGFGASRLLSREETIERLPTLETDGLRGGVVYFDGQFDDARLLIHILMAAVERGAAALNYMEATAIESEAIVARDVETGEEIRCGARAIVNAAGPFGDEVRRLADPRATTRMSPSQGIHLVFDRSFLPGDSAIMVPHTRDGRVMFAIPWLGHTLVGTTDTPVDAAVPEPRAREDEIAFLLETAAQYLDHAPTRADILSAWGGIRPLVGAGAGSTAALSRDHSIHIDPSGLLTVGGGKWTTYRRMAEDCVNQAAMIAGLPERDCVTAALAIEERAEFERWMVRRIDDPLARRRRTLFLDAKRAMAEAPAVAQTLGAGEEELSEFRELARGYLPE